MDLYPVIEWRIGSGLGEVSQFALGNQFEKEPAMLHDFRHRIDGVPVNDVWTKQSGEALLSGQGTFIENNIMPVESNLSFPYHSHEWWMAMSASMFRAMSMYLQWIDDRGLTNTAEGEWLRKAVHFISVYKNPDNTRCELLDYLKADIEAEHIATSEWIKRAFKAQLDRGQYAACHRAPPGHPQDVREVRARRTLKMLVGDKEYRRYLHHGFVQVKMGKRIYCMYGGSQHTMLRCQNRHGRLIREYCLDMIKPGYGGRACAPEHLVEVTPTDSLIVRYLMLLSDQKEFHRRANRHFAEDLPRPNCQWVPPLEWLVSSLRKVERPEFEAWMPNSHFVYVDRSAPHFMDNLLTAWKKHQIVGSEEAVPA